MARYLGLLRYIGLFLGVACVLVMLVLSFTPLAVHATNESDTYPELAYFFFGLPLAIVSLVTGAVVAFHGEFTRILKIIQCIQMVFSILLLRAALIPWLG